MLHNLIIVNLSVIIQNRELQICQIRCIFIQPASFVKIYSLIFWLASCFGLTDIYFEIVSLE